MPRLMQWIRRLIACLSELPAPVLLLVLLGVQTALFEVGDWAALQHLRITEFGARGNLARYDAMGAGAWVTILAVWVAAVGLSLPVLRRRYPQDRFARLAGSCLFVLSPMLAWNLDQMLFTHSVS